MPQALPPPTPPMSATINKVDINNYESDPANFDPYMVVAKFDIKGSLPLPGAVSQPVPPPVPQISTSASSSSMAESTCSFHHDIDKFLHERWIRAEDQYYGLEIVSGETNKFDLLALQMSTTAYRKVLLQKAASEITYLVLNMGQPQHLRARRPEDDMAKDLCLAFDITGIMCHYMLPEDEGTLRKSLKLLKRKANRTKFT